MLGEVFALGLDVPVVLVGLRVTPLVGFVVALLVAGHPEAREVLLVERDEPREPLAAEGGPLAHLGLYERSVALADPADGLGKLGAKPPLEGPVPRLPDVAADAGDGPVLPGTINLAGAYAEPLADVLAIGRHVIAVEVRAAPVVVVELGARHALGVLCEAPQRGERVGGREVLVSQQLLPLIRRDSRVVLAGRRHPTAQLPRFV